MSTGAGEHVPSAVEQERQRYRRSRQVRSVVIAAVSTIVVVSVVVAALVTSPGWPRFQETFLDLGKAKTSFPAVLTGLWLNVRLLIGCGIAIAVLSTTVAILRTLQHPVLFPLRLFATVYTDVFRGLPLLLVVFLLGFGVPALELGGLPTSALFWGALALVLCYSGYVAEVLRAGIDSIHGSQWAAARSLGLSYPATLRFVVLPQAVRRVLPALLNDAVSLQKDSGLIAVLGVVDAIRAAQIETSSDFNYTPYVLAGVLFLCLTIPMTRFTDWYARRHGATRAGGLP